MLIMPLAEKYRAVDYIIVVMTEGLN